MIDRTSRARPCRPARLAAALVAPLVLLALGASGGTDPTPDPLDDVVGWYRVGTERPACVTFRAANAASDDPNPGYWFVHLDRRWLDALSPAPGEHDLRWIRAGQSRPLDVRRGPDGRVESLIWRREGQTDARLTRTEGPYEQREVRFEAPDGTALVATMMIPSDATAEAPAPGVAIIHGSGGSSRDNHWAFMIADAIARSGVAVVYPDKRGSGQSGGEWEGVGFETLAGDAAAAMRALREDPRVDPDRTGFVGLSQGGWIAPLAAQRLGDTAFNVSVSGTVVTPAEQIRHEVAQDFRRAGLDEAQVARLLEAVDLSTRWLRTGKGWGAYLQALGELRADPALVEIAAGFPDDRSAPLLRFMRRVHDFDPTPIWIGLGEPALFLYGRLDESDNVPVEETVARIEGMRRVTPEDVFTVRVFPEMGHALADPETGWVSEEALRALTGWIGERVE